MYMKRDIFISYSRHDKEAVLPFVKQINRALGLECWIDLEGIESGEQFENIIIKAIDECEVVLFMLSDNSLNSDWTKREVYYAEGEGKRIVPILVKGDKLRGWFKFHFGNIDFIDIQSEEQKEKLIRNLKTWLSIDSSKTSKEKQALHKNEERFETSKKEDTVEERNDCITRSSSVTLNKLYHKNRKGCGITVCIVLVLILVYLPFGLGRGIGEITSKPNVTSDQEPCIAQETTIHDTDFDGNIAECPTSTKPTSDVSKSQPTESGHTPSRCLISKSDFQKRMLDFNDNTWIYSKTSFVAKNFRVKVIRTHDEDVDYVSNIEDVREKIEFGIWKSARVIKLEYDSQGYVTLAEVEPIYY